MKSFLKNLGLILVVIGAVILIACYFGGNVNDNAVLQLLWFSLSWD